VGDIGSEKDREGARAQWERGGRREGGRGEREKKKRADERVVGRVLAQCHEGGKSCYAGSIENL